MKAIIEQGSQQFTVGEGDRIVVDRMPVEAGSTVKLERVLAILEDGSAKFGRPVVDGASVEAKVDGHGRGKKIRVFKYKAKKRYRVARGHRSDQTTLVIEKINAGA